MVKQEPLPSPLSLWCIQLMTYTHCDKMRGLGPRGTPAGLKSR
nr:MAG TPA: hypothetical protein [Caudoviricetes sp.]